MKTINLSEVNLNINNLIEQAKQEDLVLEFNDGTKFMLTNIDDFDLEIAQTQKNEKLMEYLEQSSQEEAIFSLDDVKEELGLE